MNGKFLKKNSLTHIFNDAHKSQCSLKKIHI